jgi:hypothetical protein
VLKESVVPTPVASNAKSKAALFPPALGAGLALCLLACSSQTAIAIRTLDGAATSTATTDGASTANADAPVAPDADAALGPSADAPPTSTTTSTATATTTTTATATATATSTPDAGNTPDPDANTLPLVLPFSDTFDNGYDNWVSEVIGGNADPLPIPMSDATNSWLTLDSTASAFSRIHTKSQLPTTNLSASVRFRIETAPTSTRMVRLDVRQSSDSPNLFYAVGANVGKDGAVTKIGLFKKVPDPSTPGTNTICSLPDPNAANINSIPINQWVTIKITVSGTSPTHLSAYYVDTVVGSDNLMASYTDDCTSPLQPTAAGSAMVPNATCLTNQTGLGIQVDRGIKASFDDVLVTSL